MEATDIDISSRRRIELKVPEEVERLPELAFNYWWAWHPPARRLFSFLAPARWTRYHNPIEVILEMDPAHWRPLKQNEEFLALYDRVLEDFDEYMNGGDAAGEERFDEPIAYFSTEFGFHDSLPIYSGGLGVLSGDHVKSASDRNTPLIGIGLLYRHGYFEQYLDHDGTQHHVFPSLDFSRLPVQQVLNRHGHPLVVECPLGGDTVLLRVWKVQVGRLPVLLLDSNFDENPPEYSPITGQLYVRRREMRLCQEIILGVGGVRALKELQIDPSVWHLNEGHSVFLVTEQIRSLGSEVSDLDQAVERVKSNNLFTTHTPVVAGHERYSMELIEDYFADFCEENELDLEAFKQLGHNPPDPGDDFNLTAMAIRCSSLTNGVSKLHGEVSNRMWGHLFENGEEHPILSITNGIHLPTWLGYDMRDCMETTEAPWDDTDCETHLENLSACSDAELWEAHNDQKQRLIRLSRRRIREQRARHGHSPGYLRNIETLIDPDALLIGFARRFASYKRATLIFRDFERIKSIMMNREQPVQIIYAGKAHPADSSGQDLIKEIYGYINHSELSDHIFFLENYDMYLASALVQGVDVWLNNPRRPHEASGTSGMKAALNGVLNLSIVDGWWAEGYNGENGWNIGSGEEYDNIGRQDHEDSLRLYETLENSVIPIFYDRNEGGVPPEWVSRMRSSIRSVLPRFSTYRMVGDYEQQAYNTLKKDPSRTEVHAT